LAERRIDGSDRDPAERGRWGAYTAVLAAATLWGTIGPSYALLADRVAADELDIVTVRALAAAGLFALWSLLTRRGTFRVRPRDLPRLMVFALITVTAFYPVLIYAYAETSVAVGTLLLYLAPAFVTLGSAAFLHEAIRARTMAALGLALAGCALVVFAGSDAVRAPSALGIALGLASAVCYGSYSLLGKPLLARYPAGTVLGYHLVVGSLGLLVVKLAVGDPGWPEPSAMGLIAGYNGVVTTLVPITLYTVGLRRLPSSEASILATWEPVVALGLAVVVLGESLAWAQLAGAAAVLGGVVLLTGADRIPPAGTVGARLRRRSRAPTGEVTQAEGEG
jgi:drug/metabolite transporter (DMT)-like permease